MSTRRAQFRPKNVCAHTCSLLQFWPCLHVPPPRFIARSGQQRVTQGVPPRVDGTLEPTARRACILCALFTAPQWHIRTQCTLYKHARTARRACRHMRGGGTISPIHTLIHSCMRYAHRQARLHLVRLVHRQQHGPPQGQRLPHGLEEAVQEHCACMCACIVCLCVREQRVGVGVLTVDRYMNLKPIHDSSTLG